MSDAGISMWVTVDKKRILERFSSDALLDEVADRKGIERPENQRERDDAMLGFIGEAIEYLKSGRTDDALLTLERAASPKFKTFDQGVARYLKAVRA